MLATSKNAAQFGNDVTTLMGFRNFSHPTYDIDANFRFMPNDQAERVNLKSYFDVLRSSNPDDIEKIRWVFEGDHHSLDTDNIDGNYFGLFSYPRCGSTFTRRYIEAVTGIYTGATLANEDIGGMELKLSGFIGEERTNGDGVFAIKSHFPMYVQNIPLVANKAIVIVRNPFDTVWSLFNTQATVTHFREVRMEDVLKAPEVWKQFAKATLSSWGDF